MRRAAPGTGPGSFTQGQSRVNRPAAVARLAARRVPCPGNMPRSRKALNAKEAAPLLSRQPLKFKQAMVW